MVKSFGATLGVITMNLAHYKSAKELQKIKNKIKKVFFYRVCGTGMGASACLLKQEGYDVQGADSNFFPPMSEYLVKSGIKQRLLDDISDDELKTFDLIVVGNVVPRESRDALRIEKLGVPFCSFPAALGGLFLHDQNVIGIAGTHGKTTTTYFAKQVFENLGCRPGYFIGGVLEGAPSSYKGDGKYFFIESDEYDSAYFEKFSKFRMYGINHLILTSLEYDHADIYESLEEIISEFESILPSLDQSFIGNTDYSTVSNIMEKYRENFKGRTLSYGIESQLGPAIKEMSDKGCMFTYEYQGETFSFRTNIVGEHNILNLCSIIAFAFEQGYQADQIQKAIENLKLVKRRQELRGFWGESLVIDDFAHHPKAVSMTIKSLKQSYPNKKIHVVFEPHSATARSSVFQKDFESAFEMADDLILTKIQRQTTAKNAENLNTQLIAEAHQARQKRAFISQDLDQLIQLLSFYKETQDVILILSNGTCLGLWQSDFINQLESH